MKTIQHTQTLFYYDGPQVFEARDVIGGHYIAVMLDPRDDQDCYLVAGVAPAKLREFRAGLLDLKSLIVTHGEAEWFLAHGNDLTAPLALEKQNVSLVESGLLPEPGFLLHERPAVDEALKEARGRNNLVFEISVEPPEAAEEHRIHVATLVGLLGHVQTLVKHAYGAALRELSFGARREIDRSDAHLLDVIIPAAPGSFRVFLEASKSPNLFGENELGRALELVDALFINVKDPQAVLTNLKEHRGHLAGAYLRLLRFLVGHQTGFRYSWAEPAFPQARNSAISEAETAPLVEVLSGVSNLGSESVTLSGGLEKADVVNGTWRLATPDGTFSGKIKPGGPSLEGLKIGSAYRFACLEEIEETDGTGREQRNLYLIEREPV